MSHDSHPLGDDSFARLLGEAIAGAERFGHREHVHLTWLAVRRHGRDAAISLICAGLRRITHDAGVPQKYHETLTRAWVEVVAAHAGSMGQEGDFDAFVRRYPRLLDKRLISHHYTSDTLGSATARREWVAPDLSPFPWGARIPPT